MRSVGEKSIASQRRAESLNEYGFRYPFVIPNVVRNLVEKRKEILRFALNDKLIVNCQWLSIMRGTRRIMYLENNH